MSRSRRETATRTVREAKDKLHEECNRMELARLIAEEVKK